MSLPSRGAWIEILKDFGSMHTVTVAPLAGSVDRNTNIYAIKDELAEVAPLAGSVDRNRKGKKTLTAPLVAPLAGSVDRNFINLQFIRAAVLSLPSRGAWIEMGTTGYSGQHRASLPSRGAWIEIQKASAARTPTRTSLPSRGAWIEI